MKFTVITIVRNGELHIERTIKSVIAQQYKNIEYIFLDGASTDGTVKLAEKYRQYFTIFKSESDKGISDAWNKGIGLATGDIIALLNAGDEFYPDSLKNAARAFQKGADMIYGDTELVDESGHVKLFNKGKFSLWKYSSGFGMYHPSVMARKSVYDKVGGFDLGYKYAMDSDWLVRVAVSGARIEHGGHRVRMVDGGISVKKRFAAYGEHMQALQDRGAGERVVYLSMISSGIRGLLRNLLKGERQV